MKYSLPEVDIQYSSREVGSRKAGRVAMIGRLGAVSAAMVWWLQLAGPRP